MKERFFVIKKTTDTCAVNCHMGNKEQCTEQQATCEQAPNEPSGEPSNSAVPSDGGSYE